MGLRRIALLVVLVTIASACSSNPSSFPDDTVVIRVNSDLATGRERLLLALSRLDGTRLGSPDQPVTVEVAPQDEPSRIQVAQGHFDWTIEEGFGFYRAEVNFDQPGLWLVRVTPEEGDPFDTILIEVRDDSCRLPDAAAPCPPRVGEQAPSLATPSLADATLADLTTDPNPDERLYGHSLDDALSDHRPTVVVFATPAYCTSANCGPVLDNLKPVIDERPDVDFVHIEVYTGLQDPDFAPGPDTIAPAVHEWDLVSEPWVFVTDADGVITARFEGTMSTAELRERLP